MEIETQLTCPNCQNDNKIIIESKATIYLEWNKQDKCYNVATYDFDYENYERIACTKCGHVLDFELK